MNKIRDRIVGIALYLGAVILFVMDYTLIGVIVLVFALIVLFAPSSEKKSPRSLNKVKGDPKRSEGNRSDEIAD